MVNQTVVVAQVRGTVKIRLRGSNTFVDLDAAQGIPAGSTVDTKGGAVELTSIPRAGAPPETAEFYDGLFSVTQSRGITDLKLTEELAVLEAGQRRAARSRRSASSGATAGARSAPPAATAPRRSAAPKWLVQDSCAGTLTRVKQGRRLRARQGQGADDHRARWQAVHGAARRR